MRSGQFLKALSKEWDHYREKGHIKDDYQYTEQHFSCLGEIFDFLDKDVPDAERFSALKQIFFVATTEKFSTRDSVLPLQYIKICRALTTGEILVLNAVFRVVQGNWWRGKYGESCKLEEWFSEIQEMSGLEYPELVAKHEQGLINKYLLEGREEASTFVFLMPFFRLTRLGFELCSYIQKYEALSQ